MKSHRYAWLVVALLWVVACLNYLDRQVIFSVFPLIRSEMRLNDFQLGLLSTVFLWVYGFASPFGGYLADRAGRRKVLIVSLAIWTTVTLLTGFVRDFPQLLIARALMGLSEACYLPAALALIADLHGENTRSLATGLHQSGLYGGMAIGGVAGGWMGERHGWRAPFLMLGIVGLVYSVVLLKELRETAHPGISRAPSMPLAASLMEVLHLPGYFAMLAVFGGLSVANWMVYTWLPSYIFERFQTSLARAGFSATFYLQVASFAGILAGGWLADRWSRTTVKGRVLTQALGIGIAAPFLFLVGAAGSVAILVTVLIAFGVGRGFYAALTPHDLRKENCLVFDLSVASTLLGANPADAIEPVATPKIRAALRDGNVSVGIGRYNEPRPFYSSALFSGSSNPTDERRTIHLGIDLFAEPGTPISSPFDAIVHAVSNNTAPLDYGPVVILKHQISKLDSSNVVHSSTRSVPPTRHSERSPRSEELRTIAPGSRDESLFLSGTPDPTSDHPPDHFFTLYGHLSTSTLATLKPGQHIPAGQTFATIGRPHENGGWSPHLHFQIILDLLDLGTDFPGVAFASQRAAWTSLSPDPNLILGIPEKLFPPTSPDLPQTLAARQSLLGKNLSVSYSQPLKIVRGWRQFLYDDTGRAYLDVYNNVPLIGHSHPRVVHAAAAQLALLNTNTRYLHDNVLRYAERLTQLLPAPLRVCYFVNSGSEANELALRLARAHIHREDVIVLEHAYHGHTSTLIDISPYKFDGPGGTGRKPWVHVAELPDDYRGRFRRGEPDLAQKYAATVATILENCKKEGRAVAAYIAETLPSVGGQIVFPPGYLAEAYQHARAAGAVCIADEVQVGFGRLGTHFWGFETQQVVPDIVVLGKPIGNAFPLAAVITTPEIAASFANGMEFFSTFGGNPVACAAGLAVLDVLADEHLQQNALNVGTRWIAALKDLHHTHPIIGDVRGSGLFLGIDLVNDPATRAPATKQATYIVNRLRERGILAGTDGPHHNVIKLRPPLIFSDADAALFTTTLASILYEDPSRPDLP